MKFDELFEKLMLEAGGQESGKMELVKTDLKSARAFAEKLFDNLDSEIPNFDQNYTFARKMTGYGSTQRKDMHVIVKDLQKRLEAGFIDINAPFAKDTDVSNPFPEGLSGKEAEKFLNSGLKKNDGKDKDDVVNVSLEKTRVGDLKPIQKQIYFDKSMKDTAEFGINVTKKFLTTKSIFITSKDNFIIDGHHRYLAGILVDPDMEVQTLKIDLPITELLPLSLAYGDAIGNKRNK
jgi:hypothetical protein